MAKFKPYLLQRLNRPHQGDPNSPVPMLAGAFSFGGGLPNGGLSKDAMKLFKPIFSFDYMGSAEFEFGALPEALNNMVTDLDSLIVSEIEIQPKWPVYIYPKGCRKIKEEFYTKPLRLYMIVRKEQEQDLHAWFKNFEHDCRGGKNVFLKEGLRIQEAASEQKHVGWICIDEGMEFMAFVDKDSFEKTKSIFRK